jgi:hypothetical protein
MSEAKGYPTQRRQDQGITITGTITIGITTRLATIGSDCCATMTPVHARCLSLRKKTQQTDMDGPIRWFSLSLEREEHLETHLRLV